MLLCILYIVYVTTYIETSKPNHFSRIKKKGRKTLNNTKVCHICLAWILPFQHDQAYQCCKPREHHSRIQVKKFNYH